MPLRDRLLAATGVLGTVGLGLFLARPAPTPAIPPAPPVGAAAPKPGSPSTLSIALVCHREAPGGRTKSGAVRCAPETDRACYDSAQAALLAWATQLSDAGLPVTVLSDPTWYRAEAQYRDGFSAKLAALASHPEVGCHTHHPDQYPACLAALTSLGVTASAVHGGATAGAELTALWAPGVIIQSVSDLPGHVNVDEPKIGGIYQPVSAADWKTPAAPGGANPVLLQGGTQSMAKAVNLARTVASGQPINDAVTGALIPYAYVDVTCDPAEITMPDGTAGDVGISAGDTAAKLLDSLKGAVATSPQVHAVTTTGAYTAWLLRGSGNEKFIPTVTVHGQ